MCMCFFVHQLNLYPTRCNALTRRFHTHRRNNAVENCGYTEATGMYVHMRLCMLFICLYFSSVGSRIGVFVYPKLIKWKYPCVFPSSICKLTFHRIFMCLQYIYYLSYYFCHYRKATELNVGWGAFCLE